MQYAMTDQWPEKAIPHICAFMRRPELYWSVNDRLAPQPEQMNLEGWLLHPDVNTYVALAESHMVGYVQFVRKTSIGAELHAAFIPVVRGLIAKRLCRFAMADMFKQKGLLKMWSPIPSDNRAAVFAARHLGMKKEGQLRNAIVREGGVRDILLFAISRDEFLQRGAD